MVTNQKPASTKQSPAASRKNALAIRKVLSEKWESLDRAFKDFGMNKNPRHLALYQKAKKKVDLILKIVDAEAKAASMPRTRQ